MHRQVIVTTEEETHALAKEIANSLTGGEVIALSGDLGAGKTTFTQYLAKELGVTSHVNSPTFVFVKQYETSRHPVHTLIHMDAYRINSIDELAHLGLDQHLGKGHAIVVIEWAEKIAEALVGLKVVRISIGFVDGKRVFSISE